MIHFVSATNRLGLTDMLVSVSALRMRLINGNASTLR